MGSGASQISKGLNEPSVAVTLNSDSKQPDKYDKCDLEDLFAADADSSLVHLSKQELISKIRSLQLDLGSNTNNSNEVSPKIGLIPMSIFTEFDNSQTEALRTKDVLIYKLENELQSQKRLFENQKLQSKQKLASYAAEITDVRYKSGKRICELEMELSKPNKSSGDNQNPLIRKLTQKIAEQDQIISELQCYLYRKNEIIEGFKIFESNQHENTTDNFQDNQQRHSDRISKNTRNVNHQDYIMDSMNQSVELSLSNETFFCVEQLLPTKYLASKPKLSVTEIKSLHDRSRILSTDSTFVKSIKNLMNVSKDVTTSIASPKIE